MEETASERQERGGETEEEDKKGKESFQSCGWPAYDREQGEC